MLACQTNALKSSRPIAARSPKQHVHIGRHRLTSNSICARRQTNTWRIAVSDEDREVEEMKRAAEQGDLWSGEIAGILTSVGGVALAVGVIVVLAFFAQPMFDYTISSFPGQRQPETFL